MKREGIVNTGSDSSQNPFLSPTVSDGVETDDRPKSRPPRFELTKIPLGPTERGRIPAGVLVVTFIIGLCVIASIYVFLTESFRANRFVSNEFFLAFCGVRIGYGCLIISGIAAASRLTWQWIRVTSVIAMILWGFLVLLLGVVPPKNIDVTVVVVSTSVDAFIAFLVYFALGDDSARRYFLLICPQCGSKRVAAVDFFFRLAKCKNCGHVW